MNVRLAQAGLTIVLALALAGCESFGDLALAVAADDAAQSAMSPRPVDPKPVPKPPAQPPPLEEDPD